MHIQRHTHTSTHVQSAHKMNGHRSPVEKCGRKALLETTASGAYTVGCYLEIGIQRERKIIRPKSSP